jgi:hypothetical protein
MLFYNMLLNTIPLYMGYRHNVLCDKIYVLSVHVNSIESLTPYYDKRVVYQQRKIVAALLPGSTNNASLEVLICFR